MKFLALGLVLGLFTVNGYSFPDVEKLQDMNGNPATLTHKKNTELVVFWATWCPDCKEKLATKLPELNAGKEVAVIAINIDRATKRAAAYIEKEQIKVPILRDENKVLRSKLKVFSVPHWAVYKRTKSGAPWKLIDTAAAFEWDRVEKALKAIPKTKT